MIQATYLNRTAGGILKTAKVTETQAGTFEIFVDLPNNRQAVAVQDCDGNMVLSDFNGSFAVLEVSNKAESKLTKLSQKCESMYK